MGREFRTVGVVGAGTMGSGIAQLALEAGADVWLHDLAEAALAGAADRIRDGLRRRATRLGLEAAAIDDWVDGHLARLRCGTSLDVLVGGTDLVIEAAIEDLSAKQAIFAALDAATPTGTALATNTSALSVTAIASATRRPSQVVGLHFFNPAPVMRLVEVVATPASDPALVDDLARLMGRWGRVAVRSADAPGFIVNRVNRPFTLEPLAALEAGATGAADMDSAFRDAGYPMGPFELMDLIGLDVNLAVTRALHAAATAAGDPLADRFRPSGLQERLVEQGRLGRKTGAGFYGPDERAARRLGDTTHKAGARAIAVVERVELAIIDEAYRAVGERIATTTDVDTALRLGAGHPLGPFERVEQLGGPAEVLARLRGIADHDPRFAPAPALVAAADR